MAKVSLHQEWISLLEISGPFLSQKILREAFPQGLHGLDESSQRARLREHYAQWEAQKADPAIHTAWTRWVLAELLQTESYPELLVAGPALPETLRVRLPGSLEWVAPDLALLNPADFGGEQAKQPRFLIQICGPEQALNKPLRESLSGQSPLERMAELCRATGVPLGLVSNGEDWIGIHAPLGETSSLIQWQAALWVDEKITWRAFLNLLGLDRHLGAADLTLEMLFKRSMEDAFELTDQLGQQVREAVEILVHTFDRLDANQDLSLLQALPESEIYEAALTIMMRLVLMFCAEERGLLPMQNPLYRENYALATLGAELREAADQKSEDVLQYQTDAWSRLLATFRLVYAGSDHDLLKIPAYGGSLFDPDRFAFLEGRSPGSTWKDTPAEPLAVDNRTVLHLLESLQIVEFKAEGEKRRVSFRALDPEQIGYIYEGLLDHTAVRATEPILGLKGSRSKNQDHEPEIALSQLEKALAESEASLIALLQSQSKRSAAALAKDLHSPPEDTQKLKIACYNDDALLARVLPFAGLLREDSFKLPFVVNTGGVVVTEGLARASSGTHYTPRFLCEEVVQYTLEPLVYTGPAQGLPLEQWQLNSAQAILSLKICDLAMGSGAFLVQACRYLSEKLVAAWAAVGAKVQTLPYGLPSQGDPRETLLPEDPHQRLMLARRWVALHCLYGVDKNPMAVEMAKLSLWLITLAQDMPFGFLDHHLRSGDSLLGLTDLNQLKRFHLDPAQGKVFVTTGLQKLIRLKLKALLAQRAELSSEALSDWEKEVLQAECQREQAELKLYADLLVGASLAHKKGKALDEKLASLAYQIEQVGHDPVLSREQQLDRLQHQAQQLLGTEPASGQPRLPFHWVLEFPEVLVDLAELEQESEAIGGPLFETAAPAEPARLGFDGLVGNPPFLGGKKITGVSGTEYREFLVGYLGAGVKGNADLVAYFCLRAGVLLASGGNFGLVATNTLAQGDTREVGLDQLANTGTIFRADPSQKWPGTANLEVALVWWSKSIWQGVFLLKGKKVDCITSYLTESSQTPIGSGTPYRLLSNSDKSFIGSYVLGMGFIMEPEEALAWIEKNPQNKDVLFPYLNGQDLNTHPEQQPSRWVINFFDWPLDRESAPVGYGGPVAADYPEMLEIVERLVKPERTRLNEKGDFALRKPLPQKWWIYADKRPLLYKTISTLDRVLGRSRVSNTHSLAFLPTNIVASDATVIFTFSENTWFACLQSNFHDVWLLQNSSSMRTDVRYTPTDCFESFPFPPCLLSEAEGYPSHQARLASLESIGERYFIHRQGIMTRSQLGLTKTYNRFHNPDEHSPEIVELRKLHVEMDEAVAQAYGWGDLELGHGFHDTKQGLRYTVSNEARQELLDRLLALNHERYADEVAQGLHKKKGKK
jgi:hypothetical protein